ncbi:thioredoxin-like protein [Neoconidiobolus thromboides FSU 785]|nr:thioredoxin-like protein [Neoconidiobolus thromboides FSU 785]
MSNLDNIINTINFIDEDRENDKEKERQREDEKEEEREDYDELDEFENKNKNKNGKEDEVQEYINYREKGNMTGPKGVIADYRYFKKIQQQKESSSLNKINNDVNIDSINDNNNIIDEFDLELEDEEFFKLYKQKRIESLKKEMKQSFGQIFTLELFNYNDNISNVDREVPVIIHLYEKHISECQELHQVLVQLSKVYGYAKFCEIKASITSSKFDDIVLPSILVYRNNQLEHNLIRFIDEFNSKNINLQNTEAVLLRLGVLSTSDKFLIEE